MPPRKFLQLATGVEVDVATVSFRPVGGVGIDDLAEDHRPHHGGVPERLELHVTAVVGPFQFDDHETPESVNGE